MKFIFIEDEENKIVAYGPKKNYLIKMIEDLCSKDDQALIGFLDNEIKELNPNMVDAFVTIDEKVFAVYKNSKYLIKKRLYELYDLFNTSYIYINQGCLANVNRIDHFEVNLGGTLLIVFKSGYKDYVSRRKLKEVKERLGIKR